MKNKENRKIFIIFGCGIVALILILVLYGINNTPNKIENRLKKKLQNTAAEIFETDKWMKGNVEADTYVATLDDLKNKLGKDVSLFEKYKCNPVSTRVEFIVLQQQKAGQTNYKYNIILDCDF